QLGRSDSERTGPPRHDARATRAGSRLRERRSDGVGGEWADEGRRPDEHREAAEPARAVSRPPGRRARGRSVSSPAPGRDLPVRRSDPRKGPAAPTPCEPEGHPEDAAEREGPQRQTRARKLGACERAEPTPEGVALPVAVPVSGACLALVPAGRAGSVRVVRAGAGPLAGPGTAARLAAAPGLADVAGPADPGPCLRAVAEHGEAARIAARTGADAVHRGSAGGVSPEQGAECRPGGTGPVRGAGADRCRAARATAQGTPVDAVDGHGARGVVAGHRARRSAGPGRGPGPGAGPDRGRAARAPATGTAVDTADGRAAGRVAARDASRAGAPASRARRDGSTRVVDRAEARVDRPQRGRAVTVAARAEQRSGGRARSRSEQRCRDHDERERKSNARTNVFLHRAPAYPGRETGRNFVPDFQSLFVLLGLASPGEWSG